MLGERWDVTGFYWPSRALQPSKNEGLEKCAEKLQKPLCITRSSKLACCCAQPYITFHTISI